MAEDAEGESEHDWLFDYMLNAFRSPSWEVPVMTFIDESCLLFDNEAENKIIYTEKHMEFRNLIDNLLTQHLAEIGVSEEQFAKACEHGRDRRDVNRKVFDQLIAVDDFLTFKKLMVKRNVELELEVVRAMKNAGQTLEAPRSKEDEEAALEAVLRSSSQSGEMDKQKQRYEQAEQERRRSQEQQKDMQLQEAKDLKAAMEANLLEMQLYAKEMELEQAELEKALAVSLQLEEDRLARLRDEADAAHQPPGARTRMLQATMMTTMTTTLILRRMMTSVSACAMRRRGKRSAHGSSSRTPRPRSWRKKERRRRRKLEKEERRRKRREERRQREKQEAEIDEGKRNAAADAGGKVAEPRKAGGLSSLSDAPSPFGKKPLPSIGMPSKANIAKLDDELAGVASGRARIQAQPERNGGAASHPGRGAAKRKGLGAGDETPRRVSAEAARRSSSKEEGAAGPGARRVQREKDAQWEERA